VCEANNKLPASWEGSDSDAEQIDERLLFSEEKEQEEEAEDEDELDLLLYAMALSDVLSLLLLVVLI
jgi:hypothetical protein